MAPELGAERSRRAGEALIRAFESFQAKKDALTDQRLADVKIYMDKPIESAYATWRADNMSALERGAKRERDVAKGDG